MAVLTAQPIYKQYQKDAVNNRTETVGTGNTSGGSGSIIAADGSTSVAGHIGQATGIKIMQPASQPSGSNVGTLTLSQKVVQQANNTAATNVLGTGVSNGFQVAQVGASKTADKAGSNSLQNDTSAMAPVSAVYQHSVPTKASGAAAADGLSQSPETLS